MKYFHKKAAKVAATHIKDWQKEHAIGIYYDGDFNIIHAEMVSMGTKLHTFMNPREIFRPAIEKSAVLFVLVHNHPHGPVEPSDSDITVTRRLIKAGDILGIPLIDHVIINEIGDFYSMDDDGLIEKLEKEISEGG